MSQDLDGAAQLAQWLDRSRLTQLEAADKIGMDPTQLNQILARRRRPGLDNAIRIERATGIVVEAWVPFGVDETAERVTAGPRKQRTGKA